MNDNDAIRLMQRKQSRRMIRQLRVARADIDAALDVLTGYVELGEELEFWAVDYSVMAAHESLNMVRALIGNTVAETKSRAAGASPSID